MAAPQRIRQMLVGETNQGEDGQLTPLVNPPDLCLSSFFLPTWTTDTVGLLTSVAARLRCHTILKSYTVYFSRCCLPLKHHFFI